MEHVPQIELIRLAAEELGEPRRREVESHLAQCPACREIFERQTATWRVLGEWSESTAPTDLFAGIESRLSTAPAPRSVWSSVRAASRVAAAIAIGVGAGYSAARNTTPARTAAPQVSSADAAEEALADLRIEHFESLTPAGLYDAWQNIAADDQEEAQP